VTSATIMRSVDDEADGDADVERRAEVDADVAVGAPAR